MIKNKKLFLFDIDGTVCIGDRLLNGTREFFEGIRKNGGQFVLITNNSTKSIPDYMEKFNRLGIATTPGNFVTASSATIAYLQRHYPDDVIYVMGTESLFCELKRNNIHATTDPTDKRIACVLIAYDNEMTYEKVKAVCELLATREVDYLATNPDYVCPIEFGFVPDCGAICEMIAHAVGRMPHFIGKPETDMVEIALSQNGFKREETLVVGDRLYTDIECGNRAGVDTALVLTGEATKEDTERGEIKPTWIYPSVMELYQDWAG